MDFQTRDEALKSRNASYQRSRMKAHNEVRAMVRKFRFNSFVASGMAPIEAAKRLGLKLPFGRRIKPAELMKKLEELKK